MGTWEWKGQKMSCTCDCWLLKYLLNFNLCLGEIYLFPSAELKALCQKGKCQVCAKIPNSSTVSPSGQGLGVLRPMEIRVLELGAKALQKEACFLMHPYS